MKKKCEKLPLKKKDVISKIYYLIFTTSVYISIIIPISHGDNSCSGCSKCGHLSSKWKISTAHGCLGKYGDIDGGVGGDLSVGIGSEAVMLAVALLLLAVALLLLALLLLAVALLLLAMALLLLAMAVLLLAVALLLLAVAMLLL